MTGWRDLQRALKGGLPYAVEIVMLLDSSELSFPTAPAFDVGRSDLRCYRVIHSAWREGLLPDLLRLLQIWRVSGNSLCKSARRPEFQQALLEFLSEHRRAGLAALIECLSLPPAWHTAPQDDEDSVEAVHRRLDSLWVDYNRGRRAA